MLRLPFVQPKPPHLILGTIGRRFLAPTFRVPYPALKAHMHVIGRSGRGKSKALETIVCQHIANGYGCGLIDPHAALIDDLLRNLITQGVLNDPTVRSRIIYVDPTRTDYVIPFNVLASEDEPYKVAASVLEAFRRTFPTLKEAPHFENLMTHALLVLIKAGKSLMDLTRLLVDADWREYLLVQAGEPQLTAFFHDRYDQWGKEAPLMRESTLNKVTAFAINPYLQVMLGQAENHLDLKRIMDEGKILLLNLGHLDVETNRLLGSLVMTSFELAMRRRENTQLWPLTIDEFAQYMANEGSVTTLAHLLSEARKFGLGLCISHQTLSQLTPRMLGALGNTDTRLIFGVDRYDAEYLAKIVGRVDTEAIKREPRTDSQYELFSSTQEQWEQWYDQLRFQPPRHAMAMTGDSPAIRIRTLNVPHYEATDEQLEQVRAESAARYGLPYHQARQNVEYGKTAVTETALVPEYELLK
jgi:hypothetical protein